MSNMSVTKTIGARIEEKTANSVSNTNRTIVKAAAAYSNYKQRRYVLVHPALQGCFCTLEGRYTVQVKTIFNFKC